MYYLGIDHHKKYSQVAVMDQKGKIQINCKVENNKSAFKSLMKYFNGNFNNAVIEAIDRNHIELSDIKKLFSITGRKFLDSLKLSDIDTKLLHHIKQTETWIDQTLKDNPKENHLY